MNGELSNKDLARRWGIHVRNVQRRRARYGLRPVGFTGHEPVFKLSHVQRVEREHARRVARAHAERARQINRFNRGRAAR